MAKISVQDTPITVLHIEEQDYISLTDMAAAKEGENRVADIIKNWIRNRYTIEFLGTWEMIHNPDFKVVEFDHFKMNADLHSFVLSSSEGVERTNAIGIFVKRGRYGGTYAHKDIAFEFGSAISVPFKLYLINEFQRLKAEEQRQFGWSVKRELAKINYRIHTSAIRQNLMPLGYICAGEHDLRQRSRCAERGDVRAHRQTVARSQPHAERQYPRLRYHQ